MPTLHYSVNWFPTEKVHRWASFEFECYPKNVVWFSLRETIDFFGVWSQRWSGYCVDTRTARSRTRRTLKAPTNWKPQVWKVQTILKIEYILLRNLSICRCKNNVALSLELDLHREKVYEILSLVKKNVFFSRVNSSKSPYWPLFPSKSTTYGSGASSKCNRILCSSNAVRNYKPLIETLSTIARNWRSIRIWEDAVGFKFTQRARYINNNWLLFTISLPFTS